MGYQVHGEIEWGNSSYQPNRETGDPSGASYGMHWWLNRKDKDGRRWLESVPEDAVIAWGHFGQFLAIIPSQELIVVRLGLSKGRGSWNQDHFLGLITSAVEN